MVSTLHHIGMTRFFVSVPDYIFLSENMPQNVTYRMNWHRRSIHFILTALLSGLLTYSVQTQQASGAVPIQFSKAKVTEQNGVRMFQVTGKSTPGNVIIIRGHESVLVPESGTFNITTTVPLTGTKIDVQSVSPSGERSTFSFKILPSPNAPDAQKNAQKKKGQKEKTEEEEEEAERVAERKRREREIAKRPPWRAYSGNEVAFRTSLLVGNTTAVLGTLSASYWPEWTFFGATLDYEQTISTVQFSYLDLPIWYRTRPGSVNSDFVTALGVSYLSMSHDGFNWSGVALNGLIGVPFTGLLSDFMSLFPILGSHRYFEVKATYAMMPMTEETTSNGIYNLSLRLKNFYTKRFFSELSGYVRGHNLTKATGGSRTLTTAGVSIGVGYLF